MQATDDDGSGSGMTMRPHSLRHSEADLDAQDRAIINRLQDSLPLEEYPFAAVARELDLGEQEVIERLRRLLDTGVLSRFGPMYHAERMGGALTLAAMKVPEADFDRVAEIVNRFPEVAHNYQRNHVFNMWFVVATEAPERIESVIREIERLAGLKVYNMPKIEEFYVGLRFNV